MVGAGGEAKAAPGEVQQPGGAAGRRGAIGLLWRESIRPASMPPYTTNGGGAFAKRHILCASDEGPGRPEGCPGPEPCLLRLSGEGRQEKSRAALGGRGEVQRAPGLTINRIVVPG